MTLDHTGVPYSSASESSVSTSSLSFNPVYRIIKDLPLDKRSIHDIHLRFVSPQIYELTSLGVSEGSLDYDYTVNARSHDILLRVWEINGLLIKVSIHKTDTVSVVIGCSINPIALDVNGLIRLTSGLSIVEDRLSRIARGSLIVNDSGVHESISYTKDRHRRVCGIPQHLQWIVTMWHFGADASVAYSGERFSFTWETAENALVRAYSKLMKDSRTGIRLERQEYPRITLADAIEQMRLHSEVWRLG